MDVLKRKFDKKLNLHKIAVIDIETKGFNAAPDAFLFGVYYNGYDYNVFHSHDEMKSFLLKQKNQIIFAHNGGKFDYLNLFGNLYDTFNGKVIYNKSRFIMCKNGRTTFADSLNIFPVALAQLAKFHGMKKDITDHLQLLNIGVYNAETIEYCKNDCLILYKSLIEFFTEIGDIKVTIASSALSYFQRKYLDKNIYHNSKENDFIRQGYYGGRTEAYQLGKCDATVTDINSLYPAMMLNDLPNPATIRIINNCTVNLLLKLIEKYEGVTDVEILHEKTDKGYIPYKSKNGLTFPVGKFRTTVTFLELKYALENKAIKILKVYKSHIYKTEKSIYTKFVNDNYQKRLQNEGNFKNMIYKLLLNNLYGKFGQCIDEERIYTDSYNENDYQKYNAKGFQLCNLQTLNGYYICEPEQKYYKHSICILPVYITAHARIKSLKIIKEIEKQGMKVLYTDTDSYFIDKKTFKPEKIKHLFGHELGMLKIEDKQVKHIAGLKAYYFRDNTNMLKRKIKGISKNYEYKNRQYIGQSITGLKEGLTRNIEIGKNIERKKVLQLSYKKGIVEKNKILPLQY